MRSYLRQVKKRNQNNYEKMLSDYEKRLSQWIDNLPFSIKPKHFDEFKKTTFLFPSNPNTLMSLRRTF